MKFVSAVSVLRIFVETKVREFYVDFLIFKLIGNTVLKLSMPLCMQISRNSCILHLSEHYDDCCSSAAVRVVTDKPGEFHDETPVRQQEYIHGCDQ